LPDPGRAVTQPEENVHGATQLVSEFRSLSADQRKCVAVMLFLVFEIWCVETAEENEKLLAAYKDS
jgi:hypothetical protein